LSANVGSAERNDLGGAAQGIENNQYGKSRNVR
jgi:hypothetical protein